MSLHSPEFWGPLFSSHGDKMALTFIACAVGNSTPTLRSLRVPVGHFILQFLLVLHLIMSPCSVLDLNGSTTATQSAMDSRLHIQNIVIVFGVDDGRWDLQFKHRVGTQLHVQCQTLGFLGMYQPFASIPPLEMLLFRHWVTALWMGLCFTPHEFLLWPLLLVLLETGVGMGGQVWKQKNWNESCGRNPGNQ